MATTHATIAIIGLGPRGLSVLERLCANADELVPDDGTAVVHLVDPYLATGSEVWRTGQSTELLMNTVSSQVTMFVDDSVDCAGPVVPGPSLYEWARFTVLIGPVSELPEQILAEARRLGPDDYPSRAFYGHYLNWVLTHLIDTAPAKVRIHRHVDTAVDVTEDPTGRQTVSLAHGERLTGLDAVVLAQGHTRIRPGPESRRTAALAARHRLVYVPPGNPADVDLTRIEPGRPVLVRGLGLNFFDHLALLTVGRGGRFTRADTGRLVYHPSGAEPRLAAGSRRGIPYHARGENQKGPFGRHEPLFLTGGAIADLHRRADAGAPVDLRTDVWPLVDREVRAVYYATLITERQCVCDADTFLRRYVRLHTEPSPVPPPDRRHADPFDDTTSPAERTLLERFGVGPADRWDWHRVARPYGDRRFTGSADFHGWLLGYLEGDVREARRGNVHGPLKAALDVMRDLRNEIRLVVDHGRLSGDSYRDDLERWYTPFNAFVSIGPPVARIEQLIALIRAGVVDVLGPGTTISVEEGRFVGRSAAVPDSEFAAVGLIDARLPEPDIRATDDPVVRELLRRGDISGHRIPIRGGGVYRTGGLAVTTSPYRVLDEHGRAHPRRFAFGVPTETVHWVTAAGIRPGVNSVILCDADAIARAAYQVAVAASAPDRPLAAQARS